MPTISPSLLSDRELLAETARVADHERRTTAELLALLGELDSRRLYLGEGHSSLFTYCTQALHFSEPAAYSRITVARAARRFPIILERLAEGEATLTTVSLLAAHLTDENHEAMLDATRHKSKRDVERLIASLHMQPDIPSSIRRVATARVEARGPVRAEPSPELPAMPALAAPESKPAPATPTLVLAEPTRRSVVAPLDADRYLLKITLTAGMHRKLERARDLLRHTIPGGDPAVIVDRALTLLVEQLEKKKIAASRHPRINAVPSPRAHRGRHVSSAVKRAVWTRDQGRCAFVGSRGRCNETGFLEFHHVVPFAIGGATDATNLELRCRAHNQYEADLHVGQPRRREI